MKVNKTQALLYMLMVLIENGQFSKVEILQEIDITEQTFRRYIQELRAFLSNFNPAEADKFEFKPVGDGFVMTAHFPDGHTASFILTPLDGGESFNLISLNQ